MKRSPGEQAWRKFWFERGPIQEFAAVADQRPQALSGWRAGSCAIPVDAALAMARKLRMNPDEILFASEAAVTKYQRSQRDAAKGARG